MVGLHAVLNTPLVGPFPEGMKQICLGMGCFWGAEDLFIRLKKGVYSTQVVYTNGETPQTDYKTVCAGKHGHVEGVNVVYDPKELNLEEIFRVFWNNHDPTSLNRQGNDRGVQYRSGIYTYDAEDLAHAEKSKRRFEKLLKSKGFGDIVTEICPVRNLCLAEEYHQQYIKKTNSAYCGARPLGSLYEMDV